MSLSIVLQLENLAAYDDKSAVTFRAWNFMKSNRGTTNVSVTHSMTYQEWKDAGKPTEYHVEVPELEWEWQS
jgi:hypothetical protein